MTPNTRTNTQTHKHAQTPTRLVSACWQRPGQAGHKSGASAYTWFMKSTCAVMMGHVVSVVWTPYCPGGGVRVRPVT